MGREEYKLKRIDGTLTLEHRRIVEAHIGRELTSDEVVHHKDGNKSNNDISNLEVVTRAEHARIHAKDIDRSKAVLQKDENGEVVRIWKSARAASREIPGASYQNIYKCCKGLRKTAGGYMWEYAK